jgi:magnesium chelatase family protein
LEEAVIRVAGAAAKVTFPARVLLVGAMNPCPRGERRPPGGCCYSGAARARYTRRFSVQLLDRFDLRAEVGSLRRASAVGWPQRSKTLDGSPLQAATLALWAWENGPPEWKPLIAWA